MNFDISEIGSLLGGAAGTGGLLVWYLKAWGSKVNERLDRIDQRLHKMELEHAKEEGQREKELALMWREIQTDKHKLIKQEGQINKAWDTISKIAQPRISDLLKGEE